MQSVDDNESEMADRVNLVLGTIMMAVGSAMAVLIFADRSGAELDWLPSIWFAARDFHIVICVMIFVLAALVLKMPSGADTPPDLGSPFRDVRLYSRSNCELCDRALELLDNHADLVGDVKVVDIDQSVELTDRFGDCVPVLEIDGKIRFRGAIRPELLKRLAEGARNQRPLSALDGDIGHSSDSRPDGPEESGR